MQYTPGQLELLDKVKKWFHQRKKMKPWFSYSGAAGTGKTFIISAIVEELNLKRDEYICAAYTGKAATNLLRNGLPAKTIHSLIYHVYTEHVKFYDDNGNEKVITKMHTVLKDALEPELQLIFIDEATMVNDAMRDELTSFGIPIIFIGDMNQLFPIFGISSVMKYPDHMLTQIIRQKEGDPIIQLSQAILKDIPLRCGQYGTSRVLSRIEYGKNVLDDYDQIICAKNKTREKLNQVIRNDILHRKIPEPVIRDKVICRQNNWSIEVKGICLTNGLIGFVTDVDRSGAHKGYWTISIKPDFMDETFEDLKMDLKYMRADLDTRKNYGIAKYEKFEYGYAITCHLSQGSQWPRVLFIDENFQDSDTTKRLRYTAITRASQSIDIISSNISAYDGYMWKWAN